jgi:hypothetical protein
MMDAGRDVEDNARRHDSTMESLDVFIDEENLPPLASYIPEWKFWWKFAIWPIVFCVLNGIVFGTLLSFDEYDYRNQREYRRYSWLLPPSSSSVKEDTYLSMLRYNATVFAIMLFIDACLLYFAANYIEKEVQALDDLMEEVDQDPSHPSSRTVNRHHVHAQVSRKLDGLLGRGSRPKVSIFISLLLLASALCAAFGVMSVVDYAFTWTPTAKKVCLSNMNRGPKEMIPDSEPEEPKDDDIKGIPTALQSWAKGGNEYEIYEFEGGFIQLEDGTIFVAATDPRPKQNSSTSGDATDDDATGRGGRYSGFGMMMSSGPVLVALKPDANVAVLQKVKRPRGFVILSNTTSALKAPGFCCLYDTMKPSAPDGRLVSMLCADKSDVPNLDSGALRNVTLTQFNKDDFGMHNFRFLSYSSLKWYANCVWVMVRWQTSHGGMITEYYNVTVEQDKPLQLVSIVNMTGRSSYGYADPYSMIAGETSSCGHARKFVQTFALVATFAPAAYWLVRIRGVAVGIVPACGVLAVILALVSSKLAMALCIAAAAGAFFTLQGCGVPLLALWGFEELVWLLYSSIVAAATFGTRYPEQMAPIALVGCVLAGTILGHPTLYLAGWIGGVGCVIAGLFFLFVHNHDVMLALMLLVWGIVGGAGCVTVGKLAIKYRAYISYYTRRAFKAANTRMQSVAPTNRNIVPQPTNNVRSTSSSMTGDEASSMTAGLLHHDS